MAQPTLEQLREYDSLLVRLDGVEANGIMDLETVDFTTKSPLVLSDVFGRVFNTFGRVENEVAADPLLAMMPRLGTEYRGYVSHGRRFLDIWVPQEKQHGNGFDTLQVHLGLEPAIVDASTSMPNRLLGVLNKLSPAVHGVFEMIYLTRGAMHERLTYQGYDLMAARMMAMGETALATTMIEPFKVQEAGHLGYYRLAAKILKGHLEPWQLWLARELSMATYTMVGAVDDKDKPDLGHVALTLAGDELEAFAVPIQAIADKLLTAEDAPELPKFVVKALKNCVDLELQAA